MIDYEVMKEAEQATIDNTNSFSLHATSTIEWQELEMLACVLTSVRLVRGNGNAPNAVCWSVRRPAATPKDEQPCKHLINRNAAVANRRRSEL